MKSLCALFKSICVILLVKLPNLFPCWKSLALFIFSSDKFSELLSSFRLISCSFSFSRKYFFVGFVAKVEGLKDCLNYKLKEMLSGFGFEGLN